MTFQNDPEKGARKRENEPKRNNNSKRHVKTKKKKKEDKQKTKQKTKKKPVENTNENENENEAKQKKKGRKTKGGVRTPSTKVTDASKKAVKECQHAAGIKSGVACRHGLGYARGFTRLSTEAVTKRGKEGSSEQCLNAIFPAKASRSSRTRPI